MLLRYVIPLTMLILFFAFPPVTSLAFRSFEECVIFSDEVLQSQSFLISQERHYALACPSEGLVEAQSIAWVAILLYPVGVLVLIAYLLYISSHALLLEEQDTPYTRSIAFLHAPFVPKFFYFELLELTKKLLLIGFASALRPTLVEPSCCLGVISRAAHSKASHLLLTRACVCCTVPCDSQLIEPGSLLQIMAAVIVSQLFLVLHLQSMPFRSSMDNILATMVNLSLVVFFFWCSLLQTGALGDKGDIESGHLSPMGQTVSVLMLISIVGVLLVAVILFGLETAAKTATDLVEKRKREKWAGCTVDPPITRWLGNKSYACFLSHVYAARLELVGIRPSACLARLCLHMASCRT